MGPWGPVMRTAEPTHNSPVTKGWLARKAVLRSPGAGRRTVAHGVARWGPAHGVRSAQRDAPRRGGTQGTAGRTARRSKQRRRRTGGGARHGGTHDAAERGTAAPSRHTAHRSALRHHHEAPQHRSTAPQHGTAAPPGTTTRHRRSARCERGGTNGTALTARLEGRGTAWRGFLCTRQGRAGSAIGGDGDAQTT